MVEWRTVGKGMSSRVWGLQIHPRGKEVDWEEKKGSRD
jgi:hypothetical protein